MSGALRMEQDAGAAVAAGERARNSGAGARMVALVARHGVPPKSAVRVRRRACRRAAVLRWRSAHAPGLERGAVPCGSNRRLHTDPPLLVLRAREVWQCGSAAERCASDFPTSTRRSSNMTNDDIVEINQVMGLYAHVIDGKQWHRLDELYTEDGVFDLSGLMGTELRYEGIDAIKGFLTSMPMPLAHLATNHVRLRSGRPGAEPRQVVHAHRRGNRERWRVPRRLGKDRSGLATARSATSSTGRAPRSSPVIAAREPAVRSTHLARFVPWTHASGYARGHANPCFPAPSHGARGSTRSDLGNPGSCGRRRRAAHECAGARHGDLRPGDVHVHRGNARRSSRPTTSTVRPRRARAVSW